MSIISVAGAVEVGLIYSLVSLGIFLAFQVLSFQDLTADGSFSLGAAVAATMIVAGYNPWTATVVAVLAGFAAGLVTAFLSIRVRIVNLIASMLTLTALFSINLRIMGAPNVALLGKNTIFTPLGTTFGWPAWLGNPIAIFVGVSVLTALFAWFMKSEFGLAMRATGANPRMARSSTSLHIYVGLAIANGFIALGGCLFAQSNSFADITVGVGSIVAGLAAVILGEALVRSGNIVWVIVGTVIGSVLYRFAVSIALESEWIGLSAGDLNLVTAVLVAVAMMLRIPRFRALSRKLMQRFNQKAVATQRSGA
ncbi:ABC transporter permease [Bradyrhizobium sp. CCBAU 51627]|uniref:ABC transporter permease n=1 Tax=Bradyrhizobium sp. CCBAU 51627 TaxID=1325088 RepID=UPI002305DF96|nr:ABC transporter permease [Bradyrhizobium sp. CCBAU 51627]MDA9433618.1 ABC transporter permease [Bradyrhizobium sp. CCBAU 51627]